MPLALGSAVSLPVSFWYRLKVTPDRVDASSAADINPIFLHLCPPTFIMNTSYSLVMETRYTLAFDGVNDWVELPPESVPWGGAMTLSFWAFGGDRLPTSTSVICAVDAQGNRVLQVHLPFDNGYVYFDCGNRGGAQDDRFDSGNFDRIKKQARLEEYRGQWSHWTFTKDVTTGTMEIYLNGDLWHRETHKVLPLLKPFSVRLGCYFNHREGLFYHGKLAEVQLWDYARTETEIRQDMYRSLQGNEPGLRAYWPLNEGTGNIVHDKTPGANHGRIHGSNETDWVVTKLPIASPASSPTIESGPGLIPWQELQNLALQLPLQERWYLAHTLLSSIQQKPLPPTERARNWPPEQGKKQLAPDRHTTYIPIDISPLVNRRLQDINRDYPMGRAVMLGGIPFTIAPTGNNIWDANVAASGGSDIALIKIPINLSSVIGVHTLINTLWGTELSNTFLSLIFTFDDGSTFVKELIGNTDVRDFYHNHWTNQINNTTTTNVFWTRAAGVVGSNPYRLDKQFISLLDHVGKTLVSVTLVDWGEFELQRALFCGLTVQVLPEPDDRL